jgi:hypothetical protein
MVCVDGAKYDLAQKLDRVTLRWRRDLFSTCQPCRFSGSIRLGDGAALILDVGLDSLLDDLF